MAGGRERRRGSTAYAGSITTLIAFLNAGIGFVFQAIIAAQLGIGATADAFQLTWTVVTFGTVTIFSLVLTLLVPRTQVGHEGALTRGDSVLPVALGLAFSVLQLAIGLTLMPSALGIMLAWSSPSSFLAGLTATPQAMAYVQHRFVLAAMGAVGNGVGLVLAVVLIPGPSPEGLGMALSLGYLAQLLTATVPFLWESPRFVPGRSLSWPVFLGVAAYTLLSKFQPLLERLLATGLAIGATAILGFGQKTAQGILLVASFGLALTATAALARHVNDKSYGIAGGIMSRTLAATTWLSAAACSAALALAWPATLLLFYRGEFTLDDARNVTDSIVLLLPWVFAGAVTGVFTSYLYIQRSYVRVIGAAAIGIAVTLIFTALAAQVTPVFAVVVGSSAGAVASMTWAAVLVWRSPIAPQLRAASRAYIPIYLSAVLQVVLGLFTYVVCRIVFGPTHVATVLIPLSTIAALVVLSVMWRPFRARARELLSARLS